MTDLQKIEAAVDALAEIAMDSPVYDDMGISARTTLLTLVAGVCKDSARYQWLRETEVEWAEFLLEYKGEAFDRAIDLAMQHDPSIAATDKEPT